MEVREFIEKEYMNENKKPKKVVRNDKGEVVPEHCSCGGKIGVFIEGEPIYKCTACGKYYGTMPFPKKSLNESLNRKNKNVKKNTVKINESQFREMIAESVSKILSEDWNKQPDETVSETYKPLGANYSDEFIFNVNNNFKKQIADLQKFMNAYSDAILISGVIDEEKYDILFNLLGEINS